MHVATGITLRHRQTGAAIKIKGQGPTYWFCSSDIRVAFVDVDRTLEPFGPTYSIAPHDGPPIRLTACPFCGSTYLNARMVEDTPGCKDCGATAPSWHAWNKRHNPITVNVTIDTQTLQTAIEKAIKEAVS